MEGIMVSGPAALAKLKGTLFYAPACAVWENPTQEALDALMRVIRDVRWDEDTDKQRKAIMKRPYIFSLLLTVYKDKTRPQAARDRALKQAAGYYRTWLSAEQKVLRQVTPRGGKWADFRRLWDEWGEFDQDRAERAIKRTRRNTEAAGLVRPSRRAPYISKEEFAAYLAEQRGQTTPAVAKESEPPTGRFFDLED